jgi:Flp pilus assembly protein TadG
MSDRRRGRAGNWSTRGSHGSPTEVGEQGQAAVELALVLPLVAFLLLVLLQVGLIVRDQVLVVHAAREGAREAAVDPAPGAPQAAAAAASALDPARLDVDVAGRGAVGSRVRVTARYRSPTAVPLVGAFLHDLVLEASATMRVER